tara:strand:+ start:28 stop:801 length:774 start_codon:yes stop_codon:yes gene_type:complete
MVIKNSCEIFGLPGSGKTFLRSKIKKKIEEEGYRVLNSKEVITEFLKLYYKTSLFEKSCLKYFELFIKIENYDKNFKKNLKKITYQKKKSLKNAISNIIRKGYYNLCKKIVRQNKNKIKFLNQIEKSFAVSKKKIYLEWFYELLAATIIFEKASKNINKIFFFPDEAFVQKIYIFGKLPIKNKKKIIKSYISDMPIFNKIIYLKTDFNKVIKINKLRKKNQIQKYQLKKNIKKYYSIEKQIFKYKKFLKYKEFKSKI